jgi:hypothetical protein
MEGQRFRLSKSPIKKKTNKQDYTFIVEYAFHLVRRITRLASLISNHSIHVIISHLNICIQWKRHNLVVELEHVKVKLIVKWIEQQLTITPPVWTCEFEQNCPPAPIHQMKWQHGCSAVVWPLRVEIARPMPGLTLLLSLISFSVFGKLLLSTN